MNVLEKLAQHHADYAACWTVFDAALAEIKAITGSVSNRLANEREQAKSRMDELKKQAEDIHRSATVRRLAAEELKQLQARTYAVTAAEKAAFSEQIAIAEQAIADAATIRIAARATIDAANAEVTRIRSEILGDSRADLAPRRLERNRTEFDRLGGATT